MSKADIKLEAHKLVDAHCHALLPERETDKFEQYFTLSFIKVKPQDMRNTLLFKMLVAELAKYFDIADLDDTETILAERNRVYRADPAKYISGLFQAAGIDTCVLDIGFPSMEFTGYAIPIEDFRKLASGTTFKPVVRIEPIILRLMKEQLPFNEFMTRFVEVLGKDIDTHHAVAVKTAIAYVTGLEIKKVGKAQAQGGYEKFSKNQASFDEEKAFRDNVIWQTLDVCLERELPFELHTGMGDSPFMDMRRSHPLSLYHILSDEHYRKLQIVMVHAGYPYTAEVGYLANNYPNVWIDFSELNPFASIGLEPKLLELMESGPLNKIMYGSDSLMIPEFFWFSAIHFRRSFSRVLNKLVGEGVMTKKYALEVADMIMGANARRLFKIA
jgi:predicted TIM-barrel fold metal-dependent hydrolase